MCKAGFALKDTTADVLATHCVRYLINKNHIKKEDVDELIFGNVAMPHNAPNIARVIGLKAGLPISTSGYTVQRNCASGLESVINASQKIELGKAKLIIAGGTESMSNIPFLYKQRTAEKFTKLSMARTTGKKLKVLRKFKLKDFSPIIGLISGLTDPVTGNIMGKTAELLAREFNISRLEQDMFAHESHKNALKAQQTGLFKEEIVPIPIAPKYDKFIENDFGIKEDISIDYLQSKRPYFDKLDGTVTANNSSQITDGAAALILTEEDTAKEKGYKILGYINGYSHAALDPDRMGLGPIYAIDKLLKQNEKTISDYDLFEINEAFAAIVLANIELAKSDKLCQKFFNRDKAIGEIDMNKVNVNGGAIAIGHPVGMTGTRLILHLLKELKRRNLKTGIASLCVGGGQGVAVEVEVS
jgi:acetyl-CoA acetyltransferase family protein